MKNIMMILTIVMISCLTVTKGRAQPGASRHSKCCDQRMAFSFFTESPSTNPQDMYIGTGAHIRLTPYRRYIKNFWVADVFLYINNEPTIDTWNKKEILTNGIPGNSSSPRQVKITSYETNINKFIGLGASYHNKYFFIGGGFNIAFKKERVYIHHENRYLANDGSIENIIGFDQYLDDKRSKNGALVTINLMGGVSITKYARIYGGWNFYKDFSPKLQNTLRIGIMTYFLI